MSPGLTRQAVTFFQVLHEPTAVSMHAVHVYEADYRLRRTVRLRLRLRTAVDFAGLLRLRTGREAYLWPWQGIVTKYIS